MKKELQDFLTTDLNFAAYLTASGKCRLVNINQNDGWKKTFHLIPTPTESNISDYYTGTATISAVRLCETLRSLKSAVRAAITPRKLYR